MLAQIVGRLLRLGQGDFLHAIVCRRQNFIKICHGALPIMFALFLISTRIFRIDVTQSAAS
jgi:hypothetical protein